jgi:hypothetical protein
LFHLLLDIDLDKADVFGKLANGIFQALYHGAGLLLFFLPGVLVL